MAIPDKTIQVGSLSVLASSTVTSQPNGTILIRVRTVVGATDYETVQTIGAKSGPAFDGLTVAQIKAQMQSDLDSFRQRVAQEAALKEQSHLLANGLQ